MAKFPTIICARCGRAGHFRKDCKTDLTKNTQGSCSLCGEIGHNAKTCTLNPDSKKGQRIRKIKQGTERPVVPEDVPAGEPTWCAAKAEQILFDLTPKQRKSILNPAKRKGFVCGRRAGKTWGLAAAQSLIVALRKSEALCVYITISRRVAKRIIWPMLRRFDRKYGLFLKFNNVELEVTLPNGSQLWITGATDEDDVEKLRGSAYDIVIVDECASFGEFFDKMIEEIIEPALEDYDAPLVLIGTPSAACAGYFYDVTTDREKHKAWFVDTWNVLDNPEFPRWAGQENWRELAERWLEQKKKDKGWEDDNPILLREWLGVWVQDDGGLVYKYNKERNGWSGELPTHDDNGDLIVWFLTLGIDLGFDDATGFAVVASSPKVEGTFLLEDFKQSGMTTDDIALQVKTLQTRYSAFRRIVMDTGGLGKMIAAECRRRFKLPIEPAQKTSKYDFIMLMNSEIVTGRWKCRTSSAWADEARVLQWDEDKQEEDPRFPNHVCDAALYAWREGLSWQYKKKDADPHRTEEEVIEDERQRAFARAVKRVKKRLAAQRSQTPWRPTSNRQVFQR